MTARDPIGPGHRYITIEISYECYRRHWTDSVFFEHYLVVQDIVEHVVTCFWDAV